MCLRWVEDGKLINRAGDRSQWFSQKIDLLGDRNTLSKTLLPLRFDRERDGEKVSNGPFAHEARDYFPSHCRHAAEIEAYRRNCSM